MTAQATDPTALGEALAPGTPIIVFGDDWGRKVSTMQHLFRHLTAEYPVIWMNAIGHRVPGFTRTDAQRVVQKVKAVMGRGGPPVQGEGTIDVGNAPRRVIQPRVLPWHHIGPARAFNTRSLVTAIRGALAEEGLTRAPILVTGTPPSAPTLGRLGEYGSVYFCMDDFLHLPHCTPSMLAPLERELLDKVDVLVATAQALVESKRPRSGRAYQLPQGVNYEHFATPLPVPPELAALPRPLIGIAGSVTTSADLALLGKVADRFPTASVVIVGPVQTDVAIAERANVHWLGPRPYTALPAYVQAFDVGLVSYVLNQHILAVDPLKLLEYLAAGIPVVTTALPEARKYAAEVSIAGSHEDFLAAVERELTAPAGSRASRQALARQHTWEQRALTFKRILGSIRPPARA